MANYDVRLYYDADPVARPDRNGYSKLSTASQLARARFAMRFVSPEDVVADVCCGSGFMSALLECRSYIGVDHPDLVALIRADNFYTKNGNSFVPFDFDANGQSALRLDLGQKVNVALSFESIEHVKDPLGFLSHIRCNMASNGKLLLTTPNNPYGDAPHYADHVKEYSLSEMHELMTSAGFRVMRDYALGVPFGYAEHVLGKHGVKTTRFSASSKRGVMSRALDFMPFMRRLYCTVFPYEFFGATGTNMVILASKR